MFAQTILDSVGPGGVTLYSFDGGSNSFVNFSDELTVEPSNGFTFAAWMAQEPGNDG